MRLVQAGAVLTLLAIGTFWMVMWRREHAAGTPAGRGPGAATATYGR
jgi:hypothetical protein